MRVTLPFLLVFVAITALAASAGAHEADDFRARVITDKWHVSAGGYLVDFKTDAQAGFGGLLGTTIRLEDDLAVDEDKVTARLDLSYRWRPNHTFVFAYFLLDRTGRSVLDTRIEFDDLAFDVGAEVSSRFASQIYGGGYRYSVVNTGRSEAGLAFGLSFYDFRLELEGAAVAFGDTASASAEFEGAEGNLLAPVPSIGIFLDHALTPNFIFRSGATFLDVTIGDYTARVVDTHLLLEYFFWKDLGFLVGGSGTDIGVESRGDKPFSVSYRQSGVIFALSYGRR